MKVFNCEHDDIIYTWDTGEKMSLLLKNVSYYLFIIRK